MSLVTLWFKEGGVMMWPILGAAVLVLGAALDEAWKVRRRVRRAEINVVLAWGGLAAVFGLLGSLLGLAQGAASIARAGGPVATTFVWLGIKATLVTSIFGLSVFALALLMWFVLRALKARTEATGPAPA